MRGLLIDKHFTLSLGLQVNDPQLHPLGGTICRALRWVVLSVSNLPRTEFHHPTSDLGYGLPPLTAAAAYLTVCRLDEIFCLLGFKGTMARNHVHTIIITQ
jgi:hypothetical protein